MNPIIKKIRSIQYRYWSNDELNAVINKFGDYKTVINVSGWKDSDKEGHNYKDYFKKNTKYAISNFPDDNHKGISSGSDVKINLTLELPIELINQFDIALNHTVLEHIEYPEFAFNQISKLTTDLIITVIPWSQSLHFSAGQFGDYYRISPFLMRKWHENNGFKILYESYSPPYAPETYLFYVGSKKPNNHPKFIDNLTSLNSLNGVVGKKNFKNDVYGLLLRILFFFYQKIK